jgi:hypothetical protein
MSRIEVASSLAQRPKGAYISRMVLRSSRGRPQNTPAAFIVIVATLLIAAVPVCAQAQSPSVPRVSKGDAQRVVAIISGDKAKTETYCEIMKLGDQIGQAYDKKDGKMVAELSQKLETLEKALGPEYAALLDGLQYIENDQLRAEILPAFGTLAKLCTR